MKNKSASLDHLPEWANWIAMDKDGNWWCFEVEPLLHDHGWYENEVGRYQAIEVDVFKPDNWQLSLMPIIH